MRRRTVFSCAIGLLIATVQFAAADDPQDAKKLVARAVKAMGGMEKLSKLKAATWEESGKYFGMGEGFPYAGKYAIQWPHQFRMEIEGVFVIVLNKDKGWMTGPDGIAEMDKETFTEQQENHYMGWVSSLMPLSGEKYKLETVADADVAGRPAAGVEVSSEGHRDVTLYFDKESGLPVKVSGTGKSPEFGDKLITKETILSDYKEIDGVQVPMKVVMRFDDKPFVEAEITKYELHEKLDDSTFAKPE